MTHAQIITETAVVLAETVEKRIAKRNRDRARNAQKAKVSK